MRDREDVAGFIEGFSGTNRYILDYLLEEVLSSQSPGIQRFLLYTSILERLTAPLCDAVIEEGRKTEDGTDSSLVFRPSSEILKFLDHANLFLAPLDDERIWYRYHHLFADLLRSQLQRSLGAQRVAQLHIRAADWHGHHGSITEAIHHATMAADDERLERLVEQNYAELVSRGEQAGLRSWIGGLSRELVHRRPRLCIYEAYSHSWFGELDEADRLLDVAEQRTRSEIAAPDAQAVLGLLVYVRSRVTAMRGDMHRAIELCLAAREVAPDGNLALQLDTRITLGYEYFLSGDYANASPILDETIRSGIAAGAVINTVAASCLMARLYAVQGLLHKSWETYQIAARLIPGVSGQHLGAKALVEVGMADVLCERNDLHAALAHLEQGLALMSWWGKADDFILADVTLARIHLAQANKRDAAEAVDKAMEIVRTRGVFSEARQAAEVAQVKLWLAQGDLQAAGRWAASRPERLDEQFGFENEPAHIAQARVLIALHRPREAIGLLSHLEEAARSAGRMGRVIEILLLQALALRETGDSEHAFRALAQCLTLAGPSGHARIFLDEGQPLRMLLGRWLAHTGAGPLRDHAIHLLRQFDAEPHAVMPAPGGASPFDPPSASSTQARIEPEVRPARGVLVEPLSPRELEVLRLLALGRTNQEIAGQLIVSPGTVKAHTASIYRKLDVANRTEAVARARQLGILP